MSGKGPQIIENINKKLKNIADEVYQSLERYPPPFKLDTKLELSTIDGGCL